MSFAAEAALIRVKGPESVIPHFNEERWRFKPGKVQFNLGYM